MQQVLIEILCENLLKREVDIFKGKSRYARGTENIYNAHMNYVQ